MKKLILIRHSYALSRFTACVKNDFSRMLSKQGKQKAFETGKEILDNGFTADIILYSPKIRAAETAEILNRTFNTKTKAVEQLNGDYSNQEMFEEIKKEFENFDNIIAVGHNPSISDLASQLTKKHIGFSPSEYVLIEREFSF